MNARTALAAALLALAASATACTAETGHTDAKAPAKAKPHAPAAPAKPLKIGTAHHWSDTDTDGTHISGTTSVIGYTQPATGVDMPDSVSDFPHPVWTILEVKVCADDTSSNVMVSQAPWNLGFADDTRLAAPLISGAGVPKPEYPVNGAAVKPGTCLRGKILFSVDRGTRPTQVVYAPDGRDPVEWTVPKA
ncbi:hypothetical protein [Streptomyces sp. NPDC056105]|uniref:hypothetical protein n=1 Tax=Streptomyces sp. NPDC056105 TaxID=3345714 RepID=UPI0035DDAA43